MNSNNIFIKYIFFYLKIYIFLYKKYSAIDISYGFIFILNVLF
jgi:hypothetical protein